MEAVGSKHAPIAPMPSPSRPPGTFARCGRSGSRFARRSTRGSRRAASRADGLCFTATGISIRLSSTVGFARRCPASHSQAISAGVPRIVVPSLCGSHAACSSGTSQPGNTSTAGWQLSARARTLVRSTPGLTRPPSRRNASYAVSSKLVGAIPMRSVPQRRPSRKTGIEKSHSTSPVSRT